MSSGLISIDFYACRLLQGFKKSGVFDVTAIVWSGQEDSIDDLAGFKVPKIVIDEKSRVTPWPIVDRLLGIISFEKELEARKIDVVLTPYHFKCMLFFPKQYHQHAIVHDLIPYDILQSTMGGFKYKMWKFYRKLLVRKISHYISISEKTRCEFQRLEGKDSDVVYNSIPFDFSIKEVSIESVKGVPYILDVNRLQKYKNAETLIRAFHLIKDKIPHTLYLKGTMDYQEDYEQLKRTITELGIDDRVIIDRSYRSEGEMRYLYSHADLFVTPSLREGFGWTPIEAAIMMTPVLISDIEVLREITCDRLPWFNPYSSEDLSGKILDIIKNPPSKEELKSRKDFFLTKYSLKRQIDKMTETILKNIGDV